ncbi:MAG: hypothetical protein JWN06_3558, partial [Propionibacteriaceae bacterium]|nr:hypothetical protein [Propionibacteriaceae bacterium]
MTQVVKAPAAVPPAADPPGRVR